MAQTPRKQREISEEALCGPCLDFRQPLKNLLETGTGPGLALLARRRRVSLEVGMKVSVIINSKAGSVDEALIERKVREALFRCDLRFCMPADLEEMDRFVAGEIIDGTDYFMICGGDGTINVTLQSLMSHAQAGSGLPPLALVRSGTANDLALEIGVSRKIEQAARSILEGGIRKIDIIELTADTGEKSYMITNGGLGIPAMTADYANRLRGALRKLSTAPSTAGAFNFFARASYSMVKKMGPGVYSVMVAEALRRWDPEGWEIEVELPQGETFTTKASCILVNNQPSFGSNMTPAPFTTNDDGLVNVLLTDAHTLKDQVQAVAHLRSGEPDRLSINRSYELSSFKLKTKNPARPLTFFGDGEILLKDVQEIRVRCLHQGLPVVVRH